MQYRFLFFKKLFSKKFVVICKILSKSAMYIMKGDFNMTKDEEIRMINEKLDFYVMQASDEEFDTEEVLKLVKRLDELDPIPLPWKSDEEALKDFWDYCEERQREERIIAEMKTKD